MKQDNDSINWMLADIEKREEKLTDWERGFIDSITNQLGEGKRLTGPQEDKLTKIWQQITDI